MSKFYSELLKNIQYGVRYKYAPETFVLMYNGEDITNLMEDKSLAGQKVLKGDIKGLEADVKRCLRRYSKFSKRKRSLRIGLVLSDNTMLQVDRPMFTSPFGEVDLKLELYKALKEHFYTKTIDVASLNGKFEVDDLSSKRLYDGLAIKGIKYF